MVAPFIFAARLIRFCGCNTLVWLKPHFTSGGTYSLHKYAGCTVLSLQVYWCAEEKRFLDDCLEVINASRTICHAYASVRILIFCNCNAPNSESVVKLYCKLV